MKETYFFELFDAGKASFFYQVMSKITERCAGKAPKDGFEEGEDYSWLDWSKYENIDISFVRSRHSMPKAQHQHNQVSDLMWEFTVKEIANDYYSEECNPDIEDMGNSVMKLPIGQNSSHFFVKVELS